MSWEAHRWTAKTPSELYHTLGPHGVDDLIRQMIAACWRSLPPDSRSFPQGLAAARTVFDRNVGVWKRIKKVTPEAFFADLFPTDADGYCRQAMVMTWMMMPRAGGREVTDALKIVGQIFDRNLTAWSEDNALFTGKRSGSPRASKVAKPSVRAKPAKKVTAAAARAKAPRPTTRPRKAKSPARRKR